MQVGISTSCFFNQRNTEDALEPIARMGSPRFEVFLNGFLEYEKPFCQELVRRKNALGLDCTAVHTLGVQFEPQLFFLHKRQREGAEMIFQRALDIAAELGADRYVMHGPLRVNGKRTQWDPQETAERFARLCQMADARGVRLTLENVHWCLYHEPDYARRMEPYLDGVSLGYTLDTKQAAQSGYDMMEYLTDMGDRLANVHLCDVAPRENGQGLRTCLPGRGMLNFPVLAQALQKLHYKGPVTLEVYPGDYQSEQELGRIYQSLCQLFAPLGEQEETNEAL